MKSSPSSAPPGGGKSALLASWRLPAPNSGLHPLDGQTIRARDQFTAIAFQEPRFLPWRRHSSNIALGLPRGVRGRQAGTRR
ncbi:MAG: hypothetical protein U0P48_13900 [Ancrocorticia sp.]